MDSQTIYLLLRTIAVLARRQLAVEALLQKSGITKEQITAAAGEAPIPQIISTSKETDCQPALEQILKAMRP